LLTAAVTFWTAGFDIIYSCQDYEFDRAEGLFSIPSRLGLAGALRVARALHLAMLISLAILSAAFQLHLPGNLGILAVALVLVWEHRLVSPQDFSRVNAAFFTMNGYVSVLFFFFWAADILYFRYADRY
jgi:4-hydroxybenzoate polyprenyltransferase